MTKQKPKITYDMLYEAGACLIERLNFQRLFPKGVTPTRAMCIKYADQLNFLWAVSNLLSTRGAAEAIRGKIQPLYEAYNAAPIDKDAKELAAYLKALAIAFGEAWLKENTK